VLLAKMMGKAKLPAMKAVPVKITTKVTPVKTAPAKAKKSDRNHI
jgi:hypothetical protein